MKTRDGRHIAFWQGKGFRAEARDLVRCRWFV